jgi:hypothetical protein
MMNREIIDLPCGLFGPTTSDWILNVRGRSANDGVTGAGQVIYGNQPRWEATLDLAAMRREAVLAWRAIRARMRGRVNILRVCVCDRWRPTPAEYGLSPQDAAMLRGNGIPHAVPGHGTVLFSNGIGYAYVPSIVINYDIAAGTEAFTVDTSTINGALRPGQYFSIDDWPYQVTRVTGAAPIQVYHIEPPLRRAVSSGDRIMIGEATGLFAFQDDMQGRMPLQMGRTGTTQIQLIEWTNRP